MTHPYACFCEECRGETTTRMRVAAGHVIEQAAEEAAESDRQMGLLSGYKPQKRTNLKDFKRRDFLKAEHFPKSEELTVTLIELREAPKDSWSDLFLDVKCGKLEYTVGLKNDGVLLDQLVQDLGQNEKKWRGQRVTLVLAKGKYINLQRSKSGNSTPKRKAKAKR